MIYKEINEELKNHLELIDKMLETVRYGSIVITVQDGKIVQIDKTEKIRIKN